MLKVFYVRTLAIFVLTFATRIGFAQTRENNAQLTQLFEAEQAAHKLKSSDWVAANQRSLQVRKLIAADALVTAEDFYHAAAFYEYRSNPDEALLSHVMATVAAARGVVSARWLSALMLDHYLRSIWEPQMFGTHFEVNSSGFGLYNLEPALVSESLRALMCVAPLTRLKAVTIQQRAHLGMEVSQMPCREEAVAQTDNGRLQLLYEEDQSDRKRADFADQWREIQARDTERKGKAIEILRSGRGRSGNDLYHLAMIFQHGQTPKDYLLAHVLAVGASLKGNTEARWLSAAALDRYLRLTWRPQIFGTQFESSGSDDHISQETMDRMLLSDSVRAGMCVIPLSAQSKIGADANAGKELGSTRKDPCE